MSSVNQVFTQNLGAEFDQGIIEPNKIRLKTGYGIETQADGNVALSLKTARYQIPGGQIVSHAFAVWNNINFGAQTWDDTGGSVTGGQWVCPSDGVYSITTVINFFDNNSARAGHRERYLINGSVPAGYDSMEGQNYLRDATLYDSAANIYPDLYRLSAGDTVRVQAQTTSVLTGSSDITGGWLNIEKKS